MESKLLATTDSTGTPIRASDFIDGIGVDTHIPYTDGGYANLTNDAADLAYLGVKQVRDEVTDGENGSAPLSSYIKLAQEGVKFTFVVGNYASTTASVQNQLSLISQVNQAVPGSITAVEGPNEIGNFPVSFNGVTGQAGALEVQKLIYSTVKSDPALSGVAVDYFTGYGTTGEGLGPDPSTTAGLADYDTQHPYPNGGQAPGAYLTPSFSLPNETGTKGKFVFTETGYSTDTSSANGVDATVQAKYSLDLLLDAAKDGAAHTDLYDLMDAYAPGSAQGDDGYGLFDSNNQPKAAATAIHDLTSILTDTGADASTFTPSSLTYSVTGLPSTGNSLAIAKSDGDTDIAVWAEPEIYDESTKSEVAATASTVTVSLDGTHDVTVYDPLSGTTPIATYADVSSIQLQVTDHPLIVDVSPGAATSSTTTTTASGSTPDTPATTTAGSTDTPPATSPATTTGTGGTSTTTPATTTPATTTPVTTGASPADGSGTATGSTSTGTTAPGGTNASGSTRHGNGSALSMLKAFIGGHLTGTQTDKSEAVATIVSDLGTDYKADLALLKGVVPTDFHVSAELVNTVLGAQGGDIPSLTSMAGSGASTHKHAIAA